MKREVQVNPVCFNHLQAGNLTFLVLKPKDGYQCGDELTIEEYDYDPQDPTDTKKTPKGLTGNKIAFKVGFIHIIDDQTSVLSLIRAVLKKVSKTKKS